MKVLARALALPFALIAYALVWCAMLAGLLVVAAWLALFGGGRK